jgi:hypothetical protein
VLLDGICAGDTRGGSGIIERLRLEQRILDDYPPQVGEFIQGDTWATLAQHRIPIQLVLYANMGGEAMLMQLAELSQNADGQHQWTHSDTPFGQITFPTLLPPTHNLNDEQRRSHVEERITESLSACRISQTLVIY